MEYTGLIEINWSIVMIWITVIVLFLVLKKFFFEKIRNFTENRSNSIQDAFDSAEAVNRRADEKMQNYNKRIANVEAEGRELIKEAKIKADAQAREIIEDANKQASEILSKAEKNIEREKAKAMEEVRQEIAALAILAAEKIVEKEIQNVGQDEIIDEVINRARSTGWQN
ncbi:MAG: F0F1 ATP synthase subunit B [Anaerovoracaceae bacterium]